MIKELQDYLQRKKHLVFDFDRTLAKIEIDWSEWHSGISKIYSQFDQNHGYKYGKNPHEFHNKMVELYGRNLITESRKFNQEYEEQYITGFTPNTELITFVKGNDSHNLYVYSSNSRATVVRGLNDLSIFDKFSKIITKDEVEYVKPNPQGFYLIDNFMQNKELFLMIGDSSADKGAAFAAGIDFLECDVFEKYAEGE